MFDTSQSAYKTLRDRVAERTTSVVAWVGSGLSADAGLPTWHELKKRLVLALRDKAKSIEKSEELDLEQIVLQIENQKNFWVSFEMLRKNLGQATYRDLIRESLRPASTALAPLPYTYLWQLKIHGILNLNLDRLATKAFYQINNERTPTEFTGSQAASLTHVLKNPTPFIANLHGISDDADSWVFTKK